MNNDLLTFSEQEVENLIAGLEDIKNAIVTAKNDYDEYVSSKLKPQWNSIGGADAVQKLENFSNENIQKYIDSVQNNINNLSNVVPLLGKINNA